MAFLTKDVLIGRLWSSDCSGRGRGATGGTAMFRWRDGVEEAISSSHERLKRSGFPSEYPAIEADLTAEEVMSIQKRHAELVIVFDRHIDMLTGLVTIPSLTILTSPDLVALSWSRHPRDLGFLNEILPDEAMKKGVVLPVAVIGREHYCRSFWTCVSLAAPIRTAEEEIRGYISWILDRVENCGSVVTLRADHSVPGRRWGVGVRLLECQGSLVLHCRTLPRLNGGVQRHYDAYYRYSPWLYVHSRGLGRELSECLRRLLLPSLRVIRGVTVRGGHLRRLPRTVVIQREIALRAIMILEQVKSVIGEESYNFSNLELQRIDDDPSWWDGLRRFIQAEGRPRGDRVCA